MAKVILEAKPNIWDKLKLGKLRGNPEFSAAWRAVRVSAVSLIIVGINILLSAWNIQYQVPITTVPVIATALEKWIRNRIPFLDF